MSVTVPTRSAIGVQLVTKLVICMLLLNCAVLKKVFYRLNYTDLFVCLIQVDPILTDDVLLFFLNAQYDIILVNDAVNCDGAMDTCLHL